MGKNHFKFKALRILLSSCHFIARYCQWSSSPSPSPGPGPAGVSFSESTSSCLPGPGCHTMSLRRERHCCQAASGSTSHSPTGTWQLHSGSYSPLLGHPSHFVKDTTQRQFEPLMLLLLLKTGQKFPTSVSWRLLSTKDLPQGCRVKKHLSACHCWGWVDGMFVFILKLTNTWESENQVWATSLSLSLCLFELLPNIWDLFKHMIC